MLRGFGIFFLLVFLLVSCGQSNFEKALNYQNNAEYDKALSFYEVAISKNENVIQAEKNRGDIFFAQKKFKEAFECYKNAIEKSPDILTDDIFKLLSDSNKDIRTATKNMLASVNNENAKEKILVYLSTMLKSDKQFEKTDALDVASAFGNSAKPIIKDIIDLIDDENITIKQKVFEVLPKLSAIAIPAGAIEKLLAALKHPNDAIKAGAVECIGNLKQLNDFSPLVELAKTKPTLRQTISEIIVLKLRPPTKQSVENIKKYLSDANPGVRTLTLNIFRRMGNNANSFIPEILLLIADNDENVSKTAKSILSKIKKIDPATIPQLINLLNNPNKEIKLETIRLLALAGSDASAAVEKLQNLEKDAEKEVQSSARLALKQIKR